MNGPIFLCSAITWVCMGFRVSEKSKGEQTCNQNFLIWSLLHSSPVSPSLLRLSASPPLACSPPSSSSVGITRLFFIPLLGVCDKIFSEPYSVITEPVSYISVVPGVAGALEHFTANK